MADPVFKLKLDHLALRVSSLDRSVDFYCRWLGFEKHLSFQSSNQVTKIVYLKREDVLLELTSRGEVESCQLDLKRAQVKHLAWKVNEISRYWHYLKQAGLEVSELKVKILPLFKISYFFIKDPDQIEIEFVEYETWSK